MKNDDDISYAQRAVEREKIETNELIGRLKNLGVELSIFPRPDIKVPVFEFNELFRLPRATRLAIYTAASEIQMRIALNDDDIARPIRGGMLSLDHEKALAYLTDDERTQYSAVLPLARRLFGGIKK